jgi:hypothetical protein
MNPERYRYKCPRGHTTIKLGGTGVHDEKHYKCRTCQQLGHDWKYNYKIDGKTGAKITV